MNEAIIDGIDKINHATPSTTAKFISLFSWRMRKEIEFALLRRMAHRGRAGMSFFLGGLRAAASRRQPAHKEDQPRPSIILLINGWNWNEMSNGIQLINKEMRLKKKSGIGLVFSS